MDLNEGIYKRMMISNIEDSEYTKQLYEYSKEKGVNIPKEYLNIVKKYSNVVVEFGEFEYIRIWGAEWCVELNKAYGVQEELPESLAVADDGGDYCLIYMEGDNGYGLYYVGFGELDLEGAIYVARNLCDFLVIGEGIDVLLYE